MKTASPNLQCEVLETVTVINNIFGCTGFDIRNPNPSDAIEQTAPVSCAARAFILAVTLPHVAFTHASLPASTTLCYEKGHGKTNILRPKEFIAHTWVQIKGTEDEPGLTVDSRHNEGTGWGSDVILGHYKDEADHTFDDPIEGLVAYSNNHPKLAPLSANHLKEAQAKALNKLGQAGLVLV